MFLYDFLCKCGNKFEGLARIDDKTHLCERCGEKAIRLVSAPMIKLEGWSGHFPTAKQKFIKMHEKEGRRTTEE
jgi:putative FmdB family regulatory protein